MSAMRAFLHIGMSAFSPFADQESGDAFNPDEAAIVYHMICTTPKPARYLDPNCVQHNTVKTIQMKFRVSHQFLCVNRGIRRGGRARGTIAPPKQKGFSLNF